MRSAILVTTFSIILVLSCKKDDTIRLSGRYESSGIITHESLVLYTKSITITDRTFISNFLQRRSLTGSFSMKNGPDTTKLKISINYIINDSVIVLTGYNTYSDTATCEIVNKPDRVSLLITKNNTSIYPGEGTALNCTNADLKLRQYPPSPTCYPIAGSGNYCIGRQQMSIIRNTNTITVPIFSYFFTASSSTSYCYRTSLYIADFVNKETLSALGTADTVLIQTSSMSLLK